MSVSSDGRQGPNPDQETSVHAYWDRPANARGSLGNGWRAASRLICYGLLTLALLPVQIIALICWPALARKVPKLHHTLSARIIGLSIRLEGRIESGRTVLFVSNHVSYFDIIALGSVLPASFVAKSDVAGWPVFGGLARLCQTVFVERRSAGARGQVARVASRIEKDGSLIIFPEGTSSDGSRVLPFKSTLFASVEGSDIEIQPISISYTRLNGMPIGHALRPYVAWYGDMDLAPHLWAALSLGSAEVILRFHPPVIASNFSDRKALARYCQERISRGIGANAPAPRAVT
jgi:lyso-ornithine lipid O-acyltransferase